MPAAQLASACIKHALPHLICAGRPCCAGTDEDRWVRAVYRVHATIFQGYRDWCRHVDLPERIAELTLEQLRKGGEAVVRAGEAGWLAGWLAGYF